MQRFEYAHDLVVEVANAQLDRGLKATLRRRGAAGWRLVSTVLTHRRVWSEIYECGWLTETGTYFHLFWERPAGADGEG